MDEEVHRLHSRYGVDYPEHTYFERERPVVEAIRQRFIKELEAGNDVVLDHGPWRRDERDAWEQGAPRDGRPPPSVVAHPPQARLRAGAGAARTRGARLGRAGRGARPPRGGRPPPCGLPPRRQGGTAAAPGRT
ncbi:hypothetical protein ACFW1M_41770 [Streptomyces inhibens]|uniref:hypothetical protein n=1 Tax=Streptomyces inhibens TaxID=2293571 RepID=UPI00369405C1